MLNELGLIIQFLTAKYAKLRERGLEFIWLESPTGSSILAQGKAAYADTALGRACHHIAG